MFRKFIFQEICFRVRELSEGRAEALQRRREARHGRASPIPRGCVVTTAIKVTDVESGIVWMAC